MARTALAVSLLVALATACGSSQPQRTRAVRPRWAGSPRAVDAGSPAPPVPRPDAGPDDRARALTALAAAFPRQSPHDNLIEWRLPPDQRLWLATVAEDNAGPAVFWVRLEPIAGLPSSGSFGLAFPQSLALSDVDGDGRDDLVVFGAQFTGESPPEHAASEAWELPPGAPAPIRHPRLSALALAIGAGGDDALVLLRQQLDQFIPAGPQTDPAAFVIGLDRATPADLRDVVPGGGLTICSGATSGSRPRARCRRLSRTQLTDETIRTTVMPALGRFPITMRETPRPGFRSWTENVSCGVCSEGADGPTWCTSSGPEGRVRWRLARSADRWTLVRIESPPASDDPCP